MNLNYFLRINIREFNKLSPQEQMAILTENNASYQEDFVHKYAAVFAQQEVVSPQPRAVDIVRIYNNQYEILTITNHQSIPIIPCFAFQETLQVENRTFYSVESQENLRNFLEKTWAAEKAIGDTMTIAGSEMVIVGVSPELASLFVTSPAYFVPQKMQAIPAHA